MKNKRYIIKKYIEAASIEDALKKEKKSSVDEVIFDYDFKPSNVGFSNEGSGRTN